MAGQIGDGMGRGDDRLSRHFSAVAARSAVAAAVPDRQERSIPKTPQNKKAANLRVGALCLPAFNFEGSRVPIITE